MNKFQTLLAFLRENPLLVYMFVALMMAMTAVIAAMVMTF